MKTNLRMILSTFTGALLCAAAVAAQVSSGSPYTLEQSIIASGGGQSSSGGTFTVSGTVGQSIAGQPASRSPFTLNAGFWISPNLAPTAANVSISGRVFAEGGRGLQNAIVIITDSSGGSRSTRTASFGYYNFENVGAGEIYVIEVRSRRYSFVPQVVTANEDLTGINFMPQ